jgi:hypothetical protein
MVEPIEHMRKTDVKRADATVRRFALNLTPWAGSSSDPSRPDKAMRSWPRWTASGATASSHWRHSPLLLSGFESVRALETHIQEIRPSSISERLRISAVHHRFTVVDPTALPA